MVVKVDVYVVHCFSGRGLDCGEISPLATPIAEKTMCFAEAFGCCRRKTPVVDDKPFSFSGFKNFGELRGVTISVGEPSTEYPVDLRPRNKLMIINAKDCRVHITIEITVGDGVLGRDDSPGNWQSLGALFGFLFGSLDSFWVLKELPFFDLDFLGNVCS